MSEARTININNGANNTNNNNNVTPFPTTEGFSRSGGLGTGLGAQGGVAPAGTSVNVDTGDLAVEAGVDENGQPVVRVTAPAVHTYDDDDQGFDENLAERLPEVVTNQIVDEVLQGVEADEQSRAELVSQYRNGLDLIGTKIEEVGATVGQKRNISRMNDTLLLEAMVKYHAGAVAEMLPATGPAKVATEGLTSPEEEQAAQDFSDIFNYYLTEIASEYYPDHSQMIMHQAYCGNAYKKIYRCPMRNRPVSESVRMLDMIVSEEAANLDNAIRVTHQFFPSRAELKRMMILGRYKDMPIPYGVSQRPIGELALKTSEGLAPQSMRPQDAPIQMYECDLYLDPIEFNFSGSYERAAPEGMPLPYKVTVNKDARQGLAIWRNWDPADPLYLKDNMFVRYGLVPGLGFHHWGFLQLLGNQTRTLRAITRLLVDSGMFSIFPGGVKIKGARTSTNEIAPGPGEWVDIDVPGATDIKQVLMPLPYKQLDAVFVQFAASIREQAAKLGGTVEVEVGEGRTNAPVGTVMSQIEQATQIMAAVHKGNHLSQKHELMKLRKMFVKNPEDLWRLNPNPARRYETAREFADLNLLPASDPNIPAQIHRIMQITALLTIVQQSPGLWDMQEVLRRALQVLRISNPETLLLRPEQLAAQAAGAQQPPVDPAKMAQAQAKTQQVQMQHQGRMEELAADAQNKARETEIKAHAAALESSDRAADRQAQLREAAMKAQVDREKIHHDFLASQMQGTDPQTEIAKEQIKAGADHHTRMNEAQIRAQADLQARIAQAQIKAASEHEKTEVQRQAQERAAQQREAQGLAGAPAAPEATEASPEEGGTAMNAPP